jgi:hypothetical protein
MGLDGLRILYFYVFPGILFSKLLNGPEDELWSAGSSILVPYGQLHCGWPYKSTCIQP